MIGGAWLQVAQSTLSRQVFQSLTSRLMMTVSRQAIGMSIQSGAAFPAKKPLRLGFVVCVFLESTVRLSLVLRRAWILPGHHDRYGRPGFQLSDYC